MLRVPPGGFRGIAAFVLSAAVLIGLAGCRSTAGRDATDAGLQSADVPSSTAGAAAPDAGVCAEQPTLEACCEPLTPSCNECRARNKKTLAAWQAKCAVGAPKAVACDAPPASVCCNDDTAECRDCRAAAITALLVWKEKCAPSPAHACDADPPQTGCCDSLTPACDACRARNKRIVAEWKERCGK